jgi:hypothetical protein
LLRKSCSSSVTCAILSSSVGSFGCRCTRAIRRSGEDRRGFFDFLERAFIVFVIKDNSFYPFVQRNAREFVAAGTLSLPDHPHD